MSGQLRERSIQQENFMFSSFYRKLIEYKVCSSWYLKILVWRCK